MKKRLFSNPSIISYLSISIMLACSPPNRKLSINDLGGNKKESKSEESSLNTAPNPTSPPAADQRQQSNGASTGTQGPATGGALGGTSELNLDNFKNALAGGIKFIGSTLTNLINMTPLVLDLDGDRFFRSAPTVLFDMNADGVNEQIDWVASSEGFLAFDRNGNGRIDDGSELFGDATPIGLDRERTDNGFKALASFDANNDGLINGKDAKFSKLLVWKDLNHNGKSEAEELSNITEHGIVSLKLQYQNLDSDRHLYYGGRSRIKQISTFKSSKFAHPLLVADIYFDHHPIKSPTRHFALVQETPVGTLQDYLLQEGEDNKFVVSYVFDNTAYSNDEIKKLQTWLGSQLNLVSETGTFEGINITRYIYQEPNGGPKVVFQIFQGHTTNEFAKAAAHLQAVSSVTVINAENLGMLAPGIVPGFIKNFITEVEKNQPKGRQAVFLNSCNSHHFNLDVTAISKNIDFITLDGKGYVTLAAKQGLLLTYGLINQDSWEKTLNAMSLEGTKPTIGFSR